MTGGPVIGVRFVNAGSSPFSMRSASWSEESRKPPDLSMLATFARARDCSKAP
jgi:hypothetical protein